MPDGRIDLIVWDDAWGFGGTVRYLHRRHIQSAQSSFLAFFLG